MKLIKGSLLVLSLTFASNLMLFAQSKEEKIDQVLQVTGITTQISSIPTLIDSMFKQQQGLFTDTQQSKIFSIVMKNFAEKNFINEIKKDAAKNFNEVYCNKIIEAYKSDLFLDITKAEINSETMDSLIQMRSFDYSTVSQERDTILQNYIVNSGMLKNLEILTSSSIESFFTMFNLFLPAQKKIGNDQLQNVLEQTKASLKSPNQIRSLKQQYAFTYQKYSDEELQNYLSYYDADEMQWLMTIFHNGVLVGFKSCMNNAALEIVSEFHLESNNI